MTPDRLGAMKMTIRHPDAPVRRKPRVAPEVLIQTRQEVFRLSQKAMADFLGLNLESYRKYEHGRIPSGPACLLLELAVRQAEMLTAHAQPRYFSPEAIADLRIHDLRCSQTVFANLLSVTPDSVAKWEQGKRQPSRAAAILLELLANGHRDVLERLGPNPNSSIGL